MSSSTPRNSSVSNDPDKTQELRKQVDDVKVIMGQNIEKVMERNSKIIDLDQKANDLAEAGKQFQGRAKRVRKKFWWQNMKMKLIIGGSLTLVVLIILIWLCLKFANNGDGEVAVENNAQPESATENS